MTTPEGKIKRKVNQALKEFGEHVWKFMPVQASAFGMPALDYLLCYRGRFIAIETKAPGKKTTARQEATCNAIRDAGGLCFLVDDDESLQILVGHLYNVEQAANFNEAQENPPPSNGSDRTIIFD